VKSLEGLFLSPWLWGSSPQDRRGRVSMESADGIEELVVIRHARIDFFATLVAEGDGRWTVRGKAKFHDGQVMAFYHAPGNHDILRKRLLQIAKAIADFYDTTYLTQKFEKTLWFWDTCVEARGEWCNRN
jgi:hypothetical protein